MSCAPPLTGDPPGLYFNVHEKVVDGGTTYEADLGPFQDPFDGPLTNFFSHYSTTLGQTKTLELIGAVPIRISWKHHSVVYRSSPTDPGFEDTVTDEEVTLTADSPSYTWPTGFEDPGAEIEDYTAEYDDSFVAHRAA